MDDIVEKLIATGKFRGDENLIRNMVREEADTRKLLILINSIDGFLKALEEEAFTGIEAWISAEGLAVAEPVAEKTIVVFDQELPGPLARANIPWQQMAELLVLPWVEQAEVETSYFPTGQA